MASVTYGNAVYGLRDIKITNIAGSTQEDLGAAVTGEFVPEVKGGLLEGDDAVKAVLSFVTHGTLKMSAGQYSSAAVALMLGLTLSTSGSSPNEITEMQIDEGARLPYFKVYAQSYDEETGDLHLLLWKVKITSMPGLAKMANGEWRMTEFEAACIDDGTHGVVELIQHETAEAVPAS